MRLEDERPEFDKPPPPWFLIALTLGTITVIAGLAWALAAE